LKHNFTLIFAACIFQFACSPTSTEKKDEEMDQIRDSHSFAIPSEARVTKLEWEATIDFENQVLVGTANWLIERDPNAEIIHLDTRMLEIESVKDQDGNDLKFDLAEDQGYMGSELSISLKENTNFISIRYTTDPEAPALQWLDPVQTLGKEQPFLFTQSQAILARSWIPCQDSPGIRFSYSANVRVPKGLLAVMSAKNPQRKNENGLYSFEMPQPIPSYLMALAVGDFEFEPIGERTGIYAESGIIDTAAREFEDMEKMLIAAENLYGAYAWERYDLIVLPPSFPFGGMENPRITFATPTVIAGDKSLTSLVAHELAHSWSGNVVTNANWNDFWLNEGFTVYFERRIMESLYGESYAEMAALLGYNDLEKTVKKLGEDSPDTHLKLALENRDPDEGMTDIAYEKGCFLLREIENSVGRERFDQFLKSYFENFAFKPMTTEVFLVYLSEELPQLKENGTPNVEEWVFNAGIPEMQNFPSSDRFEMVQEMAKTYNNSGLVNAEIMNNWSSVEWLQFMHFLPDSLLEEQILFLDESFGFSKSGNSEIFFSWMKKLIRSEYEPCLPFVKGFLLSVGRRKFILPLFEELARKEKYRDWALGVYKEARPNYHSVTYFSVDDALGI
jgi:leukotriene-A4 hydrolase